MSHDLSQRTALVSGAASGIGRAVAERLAQAGAAVMLFDLAPSGEWVASALRARGGRAVFGRGDVTCADDARAAVERACAEFGRLDILCNVAGIIRRASVVESSEADWDRVLAVHVKGTFLLSKHAIPVMPRGGVVLNTASGWGLKGGPRAAAYCAAKGAIVNLTRAMAIDHGPQGIRVNCICPGDTDTPMLRQEAKEVGAPLDRFLAEAAVRPLGRVGTSEEIAEAFVWLASDAAAFVTGAVLAVDGGGTAG